MIRSMTLATQMLADVAAALPADGAGPAAALAGSGPTGSNVGWTPVRSLFLVGFGGTLLFLALRRLRTYKLRERYALVFGLIALPFIGLSFWPDAIGWIALKLNIQYNTLAL